MLDGRPDAAGGNRPPQRLILPSPSAVYPPPDQSMQRGQAQPTNFSNSRPMPTPARPPTYTTKKRNWRNDPAYIVLLAAVCVVLLAGVTFAALTSRVFFSGTTENTTPLKTVVTPQGTIDSQPIFPTPGGNPAGTIGSQQYPTATPTKPGQNGLLTVQANDLPMQVSNNTDEAINVTTSEANTSVKLVVNYSVPPYYAASDTQMTDANGNATILWHVDVHASPHHNTTTARLVIMCKNQHGNGAVSQTFFVKILR